MILKADFAVANPLEASPQWTKFAGEGVVKSARSVNAIGTAWGTYRFDPAADVDGDCEIAITSGYGFEAGMFPAFFNSDGSGIVFKTMQVDRRNWNSRVAQLVLVDPDGNEMMVLDEVATGRDGSMFAQLRLTRKDGVVTGKLFAGRNTYAVTAEAAGTPGLLIKGPGGGWLYQVTV